MGGPDNTSLFAHMPSPSPSAAVDSAALPVCADNSLVLPTRLHIALWNGDLAQIRACVHDPNALETRDRRGNRALHLALKFAHRDSTAIVKCLMDAGARVRSRDTSGWKTIHHAIVTENEALLRLLVQREKDQAPALLARKIDTICPRLAQLVDFYCEIRVDVSTWIPGLSRWLPSDTIKIWKREGDIRFDISLVGFENGGWKRGRLSFLLLGSGGGSESSETYSSSSRFLSLDHETRACMDLLAPGAPLNDVDLDAMVHFLLTTSIVTSSFHASNVVVREKRRWLSRSSAVQDTGRWTNTRVHDVTGIEATLRIRKPQNKHHRDPAGHNHGGNESGAFSTLANAFAGATSTRIEIDANAAHTVSTELRDGESVTWTFSTEKHDIAFGVKFFSEDTNDDYDNNYCDGDSDAGASNWVEVVPLRRCASHEQEQRGCFSAQRAGTVVFTWDNSYSRFRHKTLYFAIQPSASASQQASPNGSENGAAPLEPHRGAREEQVTFEHWFGVRIDALPAELRAMHPKRRIMMHAQPPSRELTKNFSATVFMSDQFPLSVHEFLPVIELLSKTTSAFENVKAFFEAQSINGFPVQFCVPLLPSISAMFRFDAMELCSPDAALFVVPPSYSRRNEHVLSPRKQQEVLQRVAAA